MTPLNTLTQRGFVQDVTDTEGLDTLLAKGPVTFYVGFDPTSSSLHIGHLIGLMAMAWLQRMGHRPIALAGGSTGRIGDPSFRDDERPLLDEATIQTNVGRIQDQISRVIDISSPDRGLLLDNHQWLGSVGYIEMLRDVGKHFSVNQMISRESVRRRLEEREQGISYTEFSYAVLQAYDFAHLHAEYGCRLQGGGSDQWGNIVAGVDLTRRLHGAEVFGFTWPLLERSDGKKFSKSSGEAVWMAADETSPYAFYQWFLNVPDDDAEAFLKLFTFRPLDEIADLIARGGADPAARLPQRALAEDITQTVHGDEGLAEAQRATSVLFGEEPFTGLDARTLGDAFAAAPSTTLPRSDLEPGMGVLSLMVEVGAAASNGEARRLVDQGGVRINNRIVLDAKASVGPDELLDGSVIVVRVGKKRYFLAKFE